MTDPNRPGRDPALNPTLKSQTDDTYDTGHRTPPPVSTTSADGTEGRGWPWVWLVVVVLGILLALYILLTWPFDG